MKIHILFLAAIILAEAVAAVGVSPPRIVLEDVPKNYVLEKSVTLSGIEPETKVRVSFRGEGSEWVRSKLGNEFVAEKESLEFPLIISVPQKAPNGEYDVSAQIVFSSNEKGTGPNSAVVSSGVVVNIKFTVSGKEVINYRISSVQIPSAEEGSPVFVVMRINNKGNVLAKPEKVELIVKDRTKEIITSSSTQDITSVEPYTAAESVAVFTIGLKPGFYFGDVKIHRKGAIQSIDDIPFDIVQRGAFKADGELISLEVQDNVEKIAKIDALFANRGEVGLYSTVISEIYKEGSLIDTVESNPEYVLQGQTKTFTHYYSVPASGRYTVKSHAEFLGKKSNQKEVSFIVHQNVFERENSLLLGAIIGGMLVIIILLISLLVILSSKIDKEKKKKRKKVKKT